MFITKKHIPRRTFLQGAGVTLALPLLEAMVPAQHAAGADGRRARRAGSWGSSSRTAWRRATGCRQPKARCPTKLPYILESLKKVKDQTVVMSGLWSKSAEPPEGTTGSDHWVAAAFLTGIKPRKTAGSDADGRQRRRSISMIALKIGQETLLPSLQLAVEDPNSSSSNCGEGYSCSYTNSISWVELPTPENEPMPRTSPLPMELNPQVVFERLFGSGATPEVRARAHEAEPQHPRFGARASWAACARSSAPATSRTVNQYTDEIREIERRIQLAAKASSDVPDDGSAAGHSGAVRRAHQAALRPRRRWRSRPTSPAWRRCSAPAT